MLGRKRTNKERPLRVVVSAYDPLGDVFIGGFDAAYQAGKAANGHYTRQIGRMLPVLKREWCQTRIPYVRVGFVWRNRKTGHIDPSFGYGG